MDKARSTFTIPVNFTNGELPTASKMNSLSNQTKNALALVEMMIGDVWNDSGDGTLHPTGNPSKNANFIPNLARSVGNLSLLNERLNAPTLNNTMTYADTVGTRYEGQTQAYLLYPPVIANGITLSNGWYRQSTLTQVNQSGRFFVNSNGKLHTYDPIPSNLIVTYTPVMKSDVAFDGQTGGQWNLIPDPQHWSTGFSGLKISAVDGSEGTYNIWLPPRQVLGVNQRRLVKSMATTGSDANTTLSPDLDIGYKAFQSQTVDAAIVKGAHYRYQLPGILQSLAAGTTLPAGMLYLWDESRGTIVSGINFKITALTTGEGADLQKFRITVTGIDLASVFGDYVTLPATQTASAYQTPFKLMINSVSLAQVVSSLGTVFYNHTHTNADGSLPIKHNDLTGLTPGGVYQTSLWLSDDHPQYLQRDGAGPHLIRDYEGNVIQTIERDPFSNAMLGPVRVCDPVNPTTIWTQLGNNGITPAEGRTIQVSRLACIDRRINFTTGATYSGSTEVPHLRFNPDGSVFTFGAGNGVNSTVGAGAYTANPQAAGGYYYSSPKTYYYSLSYSDFIKTTDTNGGWTVSYDSTSMVLTKAPQGGGGTCNIVAPIHLPSGATITAVDCSFNGGLDTDERWDIFSQSNNVRVSQGGAGFHAETWNGSIIIDNNYAYYLQITLGNLATATTINFYTVKITYTITQL